MYLNSVYIYYNILLYIVTDTIYYYIYKYTLAIIAPVIYKKRASLNAVKDVII